MLNKVLLAAAFAMTPMLLSEEASAQCAAGTVAMATRLPSPATELPSMATAMGTTDLVTGLLTDTAMVHLTAIDPATAALVTVVTAMADTAMDGGLRLEFAAAASV